MIPQCREGAIHSNTTVNEILGVGPKILFRLYGTLLCRPTVKDVGGCYIRALHCTYANKICSDWKLVFMILSIFFGKVKLLAAGGGRSLAKNSSIQTSRVYG